MSSSSREYEDHNLEGGGGAAADEMTITESSVLKLAGNGLLIKRMDCTKAMVALTDTPRLFKQFTEPTAGKDATELDPADVTLISSLRQQGGAAAYDLMLMLRGRRPITVKPLGDDWSSANGPLPIIRLPDTSSGYSKPLRAIYTAAIDPQHYLVLRDAGLDWHQFQQRIYAQAEVMESSLHLSILDILLKKLLHEILLFHKSGIAHGDLKPENIIIEFTGEGGIEDALQDALTSEEAAQAFVRQLQVTLIDFDLARPLDDTVTPYAQNGHKGGRWEIIGKTSREKEYSAFYNTVLAAFSGADYHKSSLFTSGVSSEAPGQRIDIPKYWGELIAAMQAPGARTKDIATRAFQQGMLTQGQLDELKSRDFPTPVKPLPEEKLKDFDAAISQIITSDSRMIDCRAQKPAEQPVDAIYDAPLNQGLLTKLNPKFLTRLSEANQRALKAAASQTLADATAQQKIEMRRHGGGGGGAYAVDDLDETPGPDRRLPLRDSSSGSGGVAPGGAPTAEPVVAGRPIPAEQPAGDPEKWGPWKTTGAATGIATGLGIIAIGVSALIVWKVAAAVTLTAIATACWPVAVAAAAVIALTAVLAFIIKRCQQAREQQQPAAGPGTPARSTASSDSSTGTPPPSLIRQGSNRQRILTGADIMRLTDAQRARIFSRAKRPQGPDAQPKASEASPTGNPLV
jgi:hypothetical protein